MAFSDEQSGALSGSTLMPRTTAAGEFVFDSVSAANVGNEYDSIMQQHAIRTATKGNRRRAFVAIPTQSVREQLLLPALPLQVGMFSVAARRTLLIVTFV